MPTVATSTTHKKIWSIRFAASSIRRSRLFKRPTGNVPRIFRRKPICSLSTSSRLSSLSQNRECGKESVPRARDFAIIVTLAVLASSNRRMATAVHSHPLWNRSSKAVASPAPGFPDLSGYNNPANALADFQRGFKTGRQAALSATKRRAWKPDHETAELDTALDAVPIFQSMSFAFLRGFASGFRETYRARFGFR